MVVSARDFEKSAHGIPPPEFPGLAAEDVQTLVARWVDAGVIKRMPEVTRVDRTLLRLR